jgi:hypothetical protein
VQALTWRATRLTIMPQAGLEYHPNEWRRGKLLGAMRFASLDGTADEAKPAPRPCGGGRCFWFAEQTNIGDGHAQAIGHAIKHDAFSLDAATLFGVRQSRRVQTALRHQCRYIMAH